MMDFEKWLADEAERDPAFRQAREEASQAFEVGAVLLAARLAAGLIQS